MALINCPECGYRMSEMAQVCPQCGCPVVKTKKSSADSKLLIKATIPSGYKNVVQTTKRDFLRKYLYAAALYVVLVLGCIGMRPLFSNELFHTMQAVITVFSLILYLVFTLWAYTVCNNCL